MENNENEGFSIDKENLKNETSSTLNEARESIKNMDFKNETEEAKGIVVRLLKNPIDEIKSVVNSDAFFKTAIFLIIIWTVAAFLNNTFWSGFNFRLTGNVPNVLRATVTPVIRIIVLSVIVLVMNRSSRRSLTTIISAVTIARIPTILASVVSLLTIAHVDMLRLTGPFSAFASVLSTVLLYFAIKELYDEEDDNSFMKTFILIQAAFFAARFLISFTGIHI